jgi:hypothetical protein
VAAIEYPYGRTVGQVHDQDGQRKVLKAALSVLENAKEPGQNLAEIKRLGAKARKKSK